jgi:ribonuclease-3
MSVSRNIPSDEDRLERAEAVLGHSFRDRRLLRDALTHPSYADETGAEASYERLEFLGDAVISVVVSELAFRAHPELSEGDLTRLKIAAVSGSTLSEVAGRLGLEDAIFLGSSELAAGGRGRASALENTFEALVAALYLDAGFDTARAFVARVLGHMIEDADALLAAHPKSALQELVQASGRVPSYLIVSESGPPHERRFTAVVEVDGEVLGEGQGSSKRDAEMRAARAALDRLQDSAQDVR